MIASSETLNHLTKSEWREAKSLFTDG